MLRLTALLLTGALLTTAAAAGCDKYAEDLATMRVADQSIRNYMLEVTSPSQRLLSALAVIDQINTNRLKELLSQCGWPIASKYGREASADAWLIIQHADRDRRFQRNALKVLERAVSAGEVRGGDFAYLSDRIAVSEGKPQLYGTQFQGVVSCKLVLAPMDSREAVNTRRRAIPGMPTLEEYEKMATEHLAPPECRRSP